MMEAIGTNHRVLDISTIDTSYGQERDARFRAQLIEDFTDK
jgi:hypothetical protein